MSFALLVVLLLIIIFAYWWFDCPYSYPKFTHEFVLAHDDLCDFEDLLDEYFSQEGLSSFKDYASLVSYWTAVCETRIEKSICSSHRRKQFQQELERADKSFTFSCRGTNAVRSYTAEELCRMYPDLRAILDRRCWQ